MQAIEMPDARPRLEAIRGRLSSLDLPEIESLPDMKDVGRMSKDVGRKSVELVNQVTGRRRRSPWRWVAIGLGLLATIAVVVVGAMAATGRWTTERIDIRRRVGARPAGSLDDRLATEGSLAADMTAESDRAESAGEIG